jgi:hypothetical protein
MPYNLLLLPLLGGFLFLHVSHYFRYLSQRLDGYRLLIQSAIAGTCLALVARFLIVGADAMRVGSGIRSLWTQVLPIQYAGTAFLSLLLGPVFALLLNCFLGRKRSLELQIKHGNSLIRLIHQAEKEKRLISITLSSRKWYVGWVAESPNLDPQELYFRLLPFMSGYRDKDSLETYRTVFYEDILGSVADTNDLVILIPLNELQSANFFDNRIYDEYFSEEELKANGSSS